jgi:APA family basic amino acid/polyamine antiporter
VPLTAVLGGLGTLGVWILVGLGDPFGRWVGLGWMAFGILLYVTYRRRQGLPVTKSVEREFARE